MKWRSSRNSVGPNGKVCPPRFSLCFVTSNSRSAERLGHIIVGARFKASHAIGLLAPAGQHDDRNMRRRGHLSHPPAHLDPRNALDHPVQEHGIRRGLRGQEQRFLPVMREGDVEILLLEVPFDQFQQGRIVFDNQKPYFAHSSTYRRAATEPVVRLWSVMGARRHRPTCRLCSVWRRYVTLR